MKYTAKINGIWCTKKIIVLGDRLTCQCGECEGNTFYCINCNRDISWCYGADDIYYDYCDECATGKFGLPPIPIRQILKRY